MPVHSDAVLCAKMNGGRSHRRQVLLPGYPVAWFLPTPTPVRSCGGAALPLILGSPLFSEVSPCSMQDWSPVGPVGVAFCLVGAKAVLRYFRCLSQVQQNSSSRFPCRFKFLGTWIGGEGWRNTVLHSELPSLFYEIVVVFACVWLPDCLPASRVSLRGSSHLYDWAPDVHPPFRLQGHDKETDGALTAHGNNKEMNFTWYLHIGMLLRITHDLLCVNILKCSLVTHSLVTHCK